MLIIPVNWNKASTRNKLLPMKTIIKLAAVCAIFLIGVGCQEKNTAGDGSYDEELERIKKSEELKDFLVERKTQERRPSQAKTEAAEAEVAKQDTVDSLTDELIVQLNHFGEAIASAKDKASAEEAVKELSRTADEIAAIAARLDKLETPSEEEKERIDEKMLSADKAMEKKMGDAMQAAMFDEKVSSIIAPAVKEFGARMEQHNAIFDRQIVTAKMRELREKANGASAPGSAP